MASTETTSQHTAPASNTSDMDADMEKAAQEQGTPDSSSAETPANAPPQQAPAQPTANQTSAVPNGGLQAWLQVMSAFSLFFNSWGLLNTFGVYQTYYESGQLFTESSSNIAWIGSIQAFFVLLIGAITGPIFDRGHLRILLVVGSFLIVFGHMMLSLCTEFWQVLLAQGFCIGMGAGCLFVPAVAILPTYFTTKIGAAIGIAASGSSMGGIIYPIVFYRLVDQIGFGWSTRVLGFLVLATQLVPIFFMRMRVKPPKARDILDPAAFKDLPYLVFVLGTFIGFIGLYTGIFYISFFAQASGITDTKLAFYLVPILNAGSVLGRTVPNIVSDKTGPFNIIAPGAIIVGIVIFCFIAVVNVAGIVIVTLLFGFFSGVFIALPPVCFVQLTKDKSKIGTRIGMGFGIIGGAVLAGGPGGGGILGTDNNNLHFTSLWIYGGVCSIAAGVIFFAVRIWKAGFKLKVKV